LGAVKPTQSISLFDIEVGRSKINTIFVTAGASVEVGQSGIRIVQ